MPTFRPAGLSDEDSDSDDYGFYEKPTRKFNAIQQQSAWKKTEINLQDAIINGNLAQVETILTCDLKNNANVKLDSGWTALMHACFHAQEVIVEFLLKHGADPNLHSDSVTPVMMACSNSSAQTDTILNIFSILAEKGCILNVGDKYGQTPLMRAISSGRVELVRKLIDHNVNIEMRDQQGWTALFWAVHHNQPEILEILIANGARMTEVDKRSRNPLEIAHSHDHQDIIAILNRHLKIETTSDDLEVNCIDQLTSWHDFYPGIEKGFKPNYTNEINHLLYGMRCERLGPVIKESGIDLKTFLLLEETDMIKLGINMPFERHRLASGLRSFHTKGWNLNAVAGLYAQKLKNYSVLDCLTTLGTHLQQLYILDATLQYTLREYKRIQSQIKFEPPDSPILLKLKNTAQKMLANVNSIRAEMKIMKGILLKEFKLMKPDMIYSKIRDAFSFFRHVKPINKYNPQPADLIKEKTIQETVINYATHAAVICSLGMVFRYMLKK